MNVSIILLTDEQGDKQGDEQGDMEPELYTETVMEGVKAGGAGVEGAGGYSSESACSTSPSSFQGGKPLSRGGDAPSIERRGREGELWWR